MGYFPKKSAFSLCLMLLALTTLVSAGGDQQLRRRELKKSSKSSKSSNSRTNAPTEEIIPIVTDSPTGSPTGTPSSSPTKKPKSTKSPKTTSAPTQQETINQTFEVAFIVNAKCNAADPTCTKENLEIENLKAYEDEQCSAGYNPNNKGCGGTAVGLAVDVVETTVPGSGRKLQADEKTYDVTVTTTSDDETVAQDSSASAVDSTEDVKNTVSQNVGGYDATPAPVTPAPTATPGSSRRILSNRHRVPVKPSRGQAAFASHRLANADKAARKLMKKGGMMNRRLKSVVKPRA